MIVRFLPLKCHTVELCLVAKAGRGLVWVRISSMMSQESPIPPAPFYKTAQLNHANPNRQFNTHYCRGLNLKRRSALRYPRGHQGGPTGLKNTKIRHTYSRSEKTGITNSKQYLVFLDCHGRAHFDNFKKY